MATLATFARLGRDAFAALGRAWTQLWFQPATTLPLEIARIGMGAAMLLHYAWLTPHLLEFFSDAGWVSRAFVYDHYADEWTYSVFYYFTAPWQFFAFHFFFLFCCAAFTVGWRTSWVKWPVLIGLISYNYRNPWVHYGVDQILCALLVVMCVAPIGRALSLDRVRAVRAAKRADLAATLPPYTSPWAGACTRLIQIQMALLFFYTGVSKVRGDQWREGDAIWYVFTTSDYYNPLLLDLLARQYWMAEFASLATIFIEVAYPFLIWQRRTRPYILAAAIFLHVMFGTLMGLAYFSFVMIMGHMSFLRPEWLASLGAAWKRKMGAMEMIYDGRCGFCVRSMAWLLAFDGLRQITIRDFRTNPSPVVGDALVERALYTVLPDGRALPGFEAYRYVVLRVPGLWWLIPFFYLPVVSRLLGHPIYNWVAANRSRLSSLRLGLPRWPARTKF